MVTLSSLKGKVVFLDFWASWCPPCRNSIPHVESLYQKLKGEKVVFLGLNLENDAKSTKQFAQRQGMNYTILVADEKTPDAYGVRGIPAFFIIDPQGRIAKSYVGFQQGMEDAWERDIRGMLAKIPSDKQPASKNPKRTK